MATEVCDGLLTACMVSKEPVLVMAICVACNDKCTADLDGDEP